MATGRSRKGRRLRQIILTIIYCVLAVTLIIGSVRFIFNTLPEDATTEPLSGFIYTDEKGDRYSISLPATLTNITPNTPFTLETKIQPSKHGHMMVKTVYTGLKLYADDELIYEAGQPGSYPEWLLDPPTLLKIVRIPEGASALRFEYLSPSQRTSVSLPVVIAGDEGSLTQRLIYDNSAILLISSILILMGILVPILGLIVLKGRNERSIAAWMGLGALAIGCWSLGECEATMIFIPFPVLLYIITYAGLFSAVVPLLKFGLIVLKPRQAWLMQGAVFMMYALTVISFSLQIMGVVALSKLLYLFFVLGPIALGAFTVTILWEYFRYKNPIAKNFAVPGVILLVAALLEVMNYYWHITSILSVFVMSGVLVFAIILVVIVGRYVRDSVQSAADKRRLEDQVRFTNRQLSIQKEQYVGIAESVESTKKARHDLRHQLSVIQGFNELGDQKRLREYLDELIASIPHAYSKSICENMAVNAVAAHYIAIAEEEGIDVDAQITIPEDTGSVPALDLCVILGNFLENAIDACRRMETPEEEGAEAGAKKPYRFIHVRTRIDGDTLSIVIRNSYDGKSSMRNGVYLSRKESKYTREGIGLSSIQAICEKHRGLARIEADKDSWKSSALIHM